jgi:Cation transporting ATPase, C-terminus
MLPVETIVEKRGAAIMARTSGRLPFARPLASFGGDARLLPPLPWNGHAAWLDLPASGAIYQSATAFALAAVVATQIGNLLAHRSERRSVLRRGLARNPLLVPGLAIELALLVAFICLPPFQRA